MIHDLLTLAAILAAWDTFRRYADAYHNRARLACVEDVAHEAMTKAEDLDTVAEAEHKAVEEAMGVLRTMCNNRDKAIIELEQRLDVQSKALAAQGETLIEHGRKITNFALASSRSK